MSFCGLMFPGVRSFLVFLSFGLRLLPLAFNFILTVASRLLHLYSTSDKTSRLKMKSFSTVSDTQRGSQLHGEEKREKRVRGDSNEMRWNQKRREQASQ